MRGTAAAVARDESEAQSELLEMQSRKVRRPWVLENAVKPTTTTLELPTFRLFVAPVAIFGLFPEGRHLGNPPLPTLPTT